VVSNLESDVAVLTLWTDARRVAAALDPRSFAACGTLYSAGGLAYLVRNLLANPRIRHLIVCGADLTGSARSVLEFFQATPGDVGSDAGLPPDLALRLRRGVHLVNLVGVTDPARIREAVEGLPSLPPWGEPVAPPVAPGAAAYTAERAGFLVRHRSAARAWVQLLALALRFGVTVRRPRRARELLAVTAVLEGDGHPEESAGWFLPGPPAAAGSPSGRPRLFEHADAAELALTAAYGGLDLLRGWPRAVVALRGEQARRADARDRHHGPLVIFAHRLRLAERDRPAAENVVARRSPRTLPWRPDPRGLFWIRVEGARVLVEHGTAHGPTGAAWAGESAEALVRAILNGGLVGLPENAAYLGRELHKAEIAARLGLAYRQDAPLELSGLIGRPGGEG
jgi:hypothetical protein